MAVIDLHLIQLLRQRVDYDPGTGLLTWLERPKSDYEVPWRARDFNRKYAGKRCFASVGAGGYLSGMFSRKRYMSHRVGWSIYHGMPIPEGMTLDHINGQVDDNRLCNLRVASPADQQRNTVKKNSGLRGACYHKGNRKWISSIRVHLGYFDTEEEAAAAYELAAAQVNDRFNLPNGVRET